MFMVLAGVLGAAAAVVGYFSLDSLARQQASGQSRNTQDVVVTAGDMTFGVKLERSMLRVVRYPKDAVPTGAFSDPDSVVGQTTKVFMSAREPVTAIKLSSRGGGLSMLVRPTMRAASLEVNNVSGVSGFVLPGDRVDVLVTINPRTNMQEAVTKTVLQNVEVLAAGQKTEQQDNKPITVQAVTVLVNPEGAEILAHAQTEGEVHLVLRNPDDQEQVQVASVSTGQMIGSGAPARTVPGRRTVARPTSAPAPVRVRPADKPNVRIIRSASVTETPAVADSSTN
jgi:pilus assembly protein CpaB